MDGSVRIHTAALELDLRECVPGYETELASQLGNLPLELNKPLAVFKCLGRYDVLSIRESSSLNLTRTPPITEGIKSEAALLAFGWESVEYTTPSLEQCLGNAAAILSLLKVSPAVSMFPEKFSCTAQPMEWVGRVAAVLNELCPDAAIYSTLGSYQLLLFQFGDDVQAMLDNMNLIRGVSLSRMENAPEEISMAPLIDDSVTLPLIAYDDKARLRTDDLQGQLKPLVFMGCPPGIETRLRTIWTDQGAEVSEVFGKPDLVAAWPAVSAQNFVTALIERRLEAKNHKDLGFTSSVLLRTDDGNSVSDLTILPSFTGQTTSDACELITKAIQHLANPDDIGIQSDALRDNLRLLLSRLQSALNGPRGVDFLDMQPFAVVLANMVLAPSPDVRTVARLERDETLTVMHGYGLRGMADRTASGALEVGSAYDMPSRQTDVARIVDAAAYVPEFILNCCDENLPEPMSDLKGNWTGFVLFDRTPGPAHGRQEIIIMPVDWLCRPIRHWWTIGHEVWHALYFRHFEEMFIDTFEELYARLGAHDDKEIRKLASELFANWMDFFYCFDEDLELFQSLVWEHWLTLAVVHGDPTYYLLRSFLIYIYAEERIAYLRTELDLSPRKAAQLMHDYWDQFVDWTSQHIPELTVFIESIDSNLEMNVLNLALLWHPLLDFFGSEFGISELRGQICYSNSNIDTQVNQLLQGEIPADPIDNPVVLLVTLARVSRQAPAQAPSPGATAAVIHALANGRQLLTNEIEGRVLGDRQETKSHQ